MQPELKKPGFVLPPMFELIRLRKQYFLRRNKENYHGKVQRADGTEYIPFAGLGAPEVDLALAAIFNDRYPKVWVVDPQQDGADYWTKAMLDNAEAIAVRCTPIAEGNHKEPCLNLLQYYAAKVALEFNLKERVSSSPDNKKPYIIDFPISYKGGPHGVSFFAQIVGNEIKISYVNSAGNLYVPEADRDLMFEKIKAGFESQGVTVNQKLEIVTGVTQNDATTCAIQQMMDAKNYIEDALEAKKAINLSDPKLRKPRSLEDCFHFLSRVQNEVRGILGDDDIVDREPQNVAQKFSDLFTTVKSLDLANLSFTKNKPQEDFYKTLDEQRSQTLMKLPGAGATAGGPDYRGTPPKVPTPVNFDAFEAEITTQANALNLKADKTSEGTYTITDQSNNPLGTIKKYLMASVLKQSETRKLILLSYMPAVLSQLSKTKIQYHLILMRHKGQLLLNKL
jgi:hypothetical protein